MKIIKEDSFETDIHILNFTCIFFLQISSFLFKLGKKKKNQNLKCQTPENYFGELKYIHKVATSAIEIMYIRILNYLWKSFAFNFSNIFNVEHFIYYHKKNINKFIFMLCGYEQFVSCFYFLILHCLKFPQRVYVRGP